MNIVLLQDEDFLDATRVTLKGRRNLHIQQILRRQVGERVDVGRVNGLLGTAIIRDMDAEQMELEVTLEVSPPVALPVHVILALPRPIVLKRLLSAIVSFGVKEITILHSRRVEKSYWQSPVLSESQLKDCLYLGLEQVRDTMLPELYIEKRFKPFLEDRVPALIEGKKALLADAAAQDPCPVNMPRPVVLAVGPEGGFLPYEIEHFVQAGFETISLGPRALRVETAVSALLGRLHTFT